MMYRKEICLQEQLVGFGSGTRFFDCQRRDGNHQTVDIAGMDRTNRNAPHTADALGFFGGLAAFG